MPELRDYQEEAVQWLLPRFRGLIHAPAGSGKTVIAAGALARRVWEGCRVLWTANTIEQCEQAAEAIRNTGCDYACDIQVKCMAGVPDVIGSDIVICDECFPAHTLIDGTAISQLKVGYFIWGYDHT